MTGIDFEKIRSDSDTGQRGCFEKFVCELARRDQPNTENCEFRRVEGSGGDGGVEAYLLCPDGTKIGYQAKYWLKARDINWRQVDKSVRKAIQTHPELTRYIVAIPCDLTDQTGTRPRRTGWQQWDEHVDKWKAEADEAGITNLEFEFWGESELLGMATRELPSGAIAYWFGATILDSGWFEKKCEESFAGLGKNCDLATNVDTSIVRHFDSFLRKNHIFDEVEEIIDDIITKETQYLSNLSQWCTTDDMQEEFDKLAQDISQLRGLFSKELLREKEWGTIKDALGKISKRSSSYALELATKISRSEKKSIDTQAQSTAHVVHDLRELGWQLSDLHEIVQSDHLLAYDKSVFLLKGGFGTGKSHALGRLLKSEVGAERPMVLFLGRRFNDRNPKQQIAEEIDIGFSEFLEALNARAEACGKIGIIAIDALNEGAGLNIWLNHLASILKEISRFPFIRTIISCRSEYIRGTVQKPVEDDAYTFDLQGFENEDDDEDEDALERALVRFMDEQGIKRPSAPFLPPAFNNPLFVSTICGALQEQGKTDFPDGIEGMVTLIDFYFDNIGKTIISEHNLDDNLEIEIVKGIHKLAKEMASERQFEVSHNKAIKILNDAISTSPPSGKNWLNMILNTGCLADRPIYGDESSAIIDKTYIFSYESFGHFLVAKELFASLNGDYDRIFEPDGALSFMIRYDALGARNASVCRDGTDVSNVGKVDSHYVDWRWRGVFIMLWIIFAEKEKRELTELLPITVLEYDKHTLDRTFVRGLFWRSSDSITPETTKYRATLSEPFWPASEPFWLASHFWAIPNHPWDAFALSKELKQYANIAERDAEWTIFLNTNYENQPQIKRLIEWTLAQKTAPNKEVAIRIMIALSWFFSSSHRKLRDRATRALAHMLRLRPELIPKLFKEFTEVDDPYIMERLLAALYGACQFIGAETDDKRCVGEVAQCVYDTIFADETPPLHLLVRDYAQGIIERADYLSALPSSIDLDKCTPPYKSDYPKAFQNNDPGTLYTNEAIDTLSKSAGSKGKKISISNATISRSGTYGDFGRYVLQPRIGDFSRVTIDQPPPEEIEHSDFFNHELIGNWVARRVYEYYGWTEKLFPNEPNSYGRDRSIIERIGKKYQWISMYELLGILADHVYARGRWRDEIKIYTSTEDLSYVRDIDPTISIGINKHEIPELPHLETNEPLPKENDEISKIRGWLFDKKIVITDLKNKIKNAQAKGRRWYMLHSFYYKNIASIKSEQIILNEFFLLSAHCLSVADMKKFLKENRKECLSDFFDPTRKEPRELFEGKFLLEMDWRNLPAPSKNDYNETLRGIPHYHPIHEYAFPKSNYETDHNGSFLPHPRIMSHFGLKIDSEHPNLVRDQKNNIVFYTHSKQNEDDSQQVCYIDADLFDEFLKKNDLVCVWLLGGERMWMIVNTLNDRRCFSSMAWMENNQMQVEDWHEDIQNKG